MKSELSVLYALAEYNAGKMKQSQIEEIGDIKQKLYSEKSPFLVNDHDEYPLHLFNPRLRKLLVQGHLNKLWEYLTCRENVIRMIAVTEVQRPAVEAFSDEIFEYFNKSEEDTFISFKQCVGFMIKIIMEMFGFVVDQKQVNILRRYSNPEEFSFTNASRYRKMSKEDFKIEDDEIKKDLLKITSQILKSKSFYQRIYKLDKNTNWNKL